MNEIKELTQETIAKRNYYKVWRQKNKKKIKQYNKNFWIKKANNNNNNNNNNNKIKER